jgi:hypothetical protein
MKRNMRTAFNALKKIGCPVIEGHDREDRFIISAEMNCEDVNETVWADYYQPEMGEFGVCQQIVDILKLNHLYPEWINPGAVGIAEE